MHDANNEHIIHEAEIVERVSLLLEKFKSLALAAKNILFPEV